MPAATIKSSLKVGETTYEYAETKSGNSGGGPRGIDIWIKGVKGRSMYSITPNPHDSKKYNKKQADFYALMAKALADDHVANSAFPSAKTGVKWDGQDYAMR